jgi:hypothetical protein
MMNKNGSGKKSSHGLFQGTDPAFAWSDWEKACKPIRTAVSWMRFKTDISQIQVRSLTL